MTARALVLAFVTLAVVACAGNRFHITNAPPQIFAPDIHGQASDAPLVREYQGPLADAPDVREFAAQADGLRLEAIAHNQRMLGLPDDFAPFTRVVLCDRPDSEDANMMTVHVDRGAQRHAYVLVYANGLVSKRCKPHSTFVHEVNHTLLSEYLGPAYDTLPQWFVEGVALHCAGQTWERLDIQLGYELWRSNNEDEASLVAERTCDGIGAEHGYDDYAESALCVEYLVNETPDALPRMVAALKGGATFDDALREVSGKPRKDFELAAHKFALGQAKIREGGRGKLVFPLMRTIRGDELHAEDFDSEKERRVALEEITSLGSLQQEASFATPVLRHVAAVSKLKSETFSQAAELLEQFLAGPQGAGPLTGNALEALALAYTGLGDHDRAREACLRLIHGFNYAPERVEWAKTQLSKLDPP
ncbi:MAG: hypothetical protein L6Q71_09860 [Planctomycetes bacterium]|nr:hypothetical protein [Planctomycetota bacterium]NUQ35233.1 hypothetical protein [Planctomycetaceae bacterium]